MLTVEYIATPEDVSALYSYAWRHSGHFRRRMGLSALFVAVWMLAVVCLNQGKMGKVDALIALIVVMASPLLTPYLAKLRTKKDRRTLSIDPTGIHTQIGAQKGEIRWARIADVFATEEHIFILGRNLNGFTIPRHAFLNDSQRIEFIRLCEDYSKLRRPRSKAQKRAFWILGFFLGLLVIFSPPLYAFGWHLRHGNVLIYKDKHVLVPPGWIADAEPQGLTMRRLPSTLCTFFQLGWLARWISISKGAPLRNRTVQEAEESFEKAFWTYPLAPAHAAVSGPIRMGVPPNDVFCMKATSSDGVRPVFVDCMLQQGTWSAHLVGEEKDVEAFYEVLQAFN